MKGPHNKEYNCIPALCTYIADLPEQYVDTYTMLANIRPVPKAKISLKANSNFSKKWQRSILLPTMSNSHILIPLSLRTRIRCQQRVKKDF